MSSQPLLVDLNGQHLLADAPAVCVLDRGFLYGDGLFETLRAYDGVPFGLDAHLARLRASAAELRLSDRLDTAAIARRVAELVRVQGLRDAYIRITVTRGRHGGPLELTPAVQPTVAIIARPTRALPPSLYQQGVTAAVVAIRQNADSPLPRHKTLNYLGRLLANTEARERGAEHAIVLNTRGQVAEAATSNLFLAFGRRLVTPSLETNILPGTTRAAVVRLARQAAIAVEERPVAPEELHQADEAFLTNAIVEVLPVRAIDSRPVGRGMPGALTRELHGAYRALVGRHQGLRPAAVKETPSP